ncbi:MAG: glycine/sarcosine/betaine reductase selenoprotein B family protein [Candidatus Neomarinimicrobiota bacterium]
MKKTDFSYLSERKKILYEQVARAYRSQDRQKHTDWVPFKERLIDSRIALISIAGAYTSDQKPFTVEGKEQDYEPREISLGVTKENLNFFPMDWEQSEAKKDFNVVLPIERLVLLQKEGRIGKIHDPIYSFSGHSANKKFLMKYVYRTVEKIKAADNNGVLIVPCSPRTSETACLIASEIERRGISTVMLTLFYEQALIMAPPRCAFVNFPFGRPFGKADHVTLHTAIIRDTLRLFEKTKIPGEVLSLNFVWSFGEIPV